MIQATLLVALTELVDIKYKTMHYQSKDFYLCTFNK